MSAPPIHPYRPNPFAGSPLDRLDASRADAALVTGLLHHPATRAVPVWRGRNLIEGEKAQRLAAFPSIAGYAHLVDAHPWALLGERNGVHLFAIDLSAVDSPDVAAGAAFEDLRRIGGILPADDAAILAHARGLMHWRTRHRFCGVCGAACTPGSAGHVMLCGGCGTHHFPRTDPAVIMLVTHGDKALLGQPARFRDVRVFTTLAGFVEPGESLEEAVAREVWEEARVRVGGVRYHSSQPWPFPASIMLGFTAEAASLEVQADAKELVEARWFTRQEAAAQDGFILPPDISIARRLIDGWIASGA